MTYIKEASVSWDTSDYPPILGAETIVRFTDWEVDQNMEYFVRAWLFKERGFQDEIVIHPNWSEVKWSISADQAKDKAFYLGNKRIRPDGNNQSDQLTFGRRLTEQEILEHFHVQEVDMYPFIMVEPEMHTVKRIGRTTRFPQVDLAP